jgi:acetyl-CoA/propionyl-CoA carboxylase biotin carboxyl carrier protein
MFSKVLVANRAEIAVRILRTCRELGVASVAVHSTPDASSLHVRSADEAVHLEGSAAGETYLDIAKVIQAAHDSGADAIHPGYGFLAENASFAAAVNDAGLAFIGPPAEAIKIMGGKVAAREVAAAAGVPQVPGSKGNIESADEVTAFGAEHGYPVAVKASYGGGGRGMRTVANANGAAEAFDAARRESLAAFGRDEIYLERYLENARHVEVQVFADSHGNTVWLGDRDCSVQRRHQKVIEEAPAPGLSPELRIAMGEAAVRLARAVDYLGAGTVEFLVEAEREQFYFLEMNTRIQVEHPVTEQTLGVDLVAEQLRVAAGEPLTVRSSGPEPRGHAIEVRVNAEDVSEGLFRPSPGVLGVVSVPSRPGVRFDCGYETGDEVLPFYDSLIGKLIVWAPTREHAIDRTLQCLKGMRIEGVPTTLRAAEVLLTHPDFRRADINTRWLEHSLDLSALLPALDHPSIGGAAHTDVEDRQEVFVGGRRYLVPISQGSGVPETSGKTPTRPRNPGARRPRPANAPANAPSFGTLTSPMQGTVTAVRAVKGQSVEREEILIVIEAMKMETPIRAALAGTITSIMAEIGQVVSAGTVLAEIAASA